MQQNVKQRYRWTISNIEGQEFWHTVSTGNKVIESEVCTDKVRLRTKTVRMQAKKAAIEAVNSASIKTDAELVVIKAEKAFRKKADRTQTVYAVNKHRRTKRNKRR